MSVATGGRPIDLAGWQVKRLQAGTLSQVWVPMRPQPVWDGVFWTWAGAGWNTDGPVTPVYGHSMWVRCPYKPGTRFWVRERYAPRLDVNPREEPEKARHYALYEADGSDLDDLHWHSYPDRWWPANRMDPALSRYTLQSVTARAVKVFEAADVLSPGSGFNAFDEFFVWWDTRFGAKYPAATAWAWAVEVKEVQP